MGNAMSVYPQRHALTDPRDPLLAKWEESNSARRLAWVKHAAEGGHPEVVSALETDGIAVQPAGDLVNKAHLALMHEAIQGQVCTQETTRRIEATKQKLWKDFCLLIRYGAAALENHPALRVALDHRLLAAIAPYYGMWPRLADICVHVNYPTETDASASQLWHRDPGDIKLVKVFIYLCDVTMENGPFCYIPGTQPFGRHAALIPPQHVDAKIDSGERDIRWTDEEMAAVIPRKDWKVVTGPEHTMIIADTVGFHRGLKPQSGARMLVCFTYTSGISDPPLKVKLPVWANKECQGWALR